MANKKVQQSEKKRYKVMSVEGQDIYLTLTPEEYELYQILSQEGGEEGQHSAGNMVIKETAERIRQYSDLYRIEGLGEKGEIFNTELIVRVVLEQIQESESWQEWLKQRELIRKPEPYFAFPSNPIMFALLALFCGKPGKIPRHLLLKPPSKRTPTEQIEADAFITSIMEKGARKVFTPSGQSDQITYTALIADNPQVRARAEIDDTLFKDNLLRQEGALALYIKRTFGAEGLRHLLGLIIGLEEKGRTGTFLWCLKDHADRLGQKKEKGTYNARFKEVASAIVKIFTSLYLTTYRKKGKKENIEGERLFSIDGFKVEIFDKRIIDEILKIRATDCWYGNAFNPPGISAPTYTKLLKKIVKENHREHAITIVLTPFLAIYWRINGPQARLSVASLIEWCGMDRGVKNRIRDLQKLETELDYMTQQGYLKSWGNGMIAPPSQSPLPLDCVLTLEAPEWLAKEIKAIEERRDAFLPLPDNREELISPLTPEQFEIFLSRLRALGKSYSTIASDLGVRSKNTIANARKRRKVSLGLAGKIKQAYPDLYEEIVS